MQFPTFRTILFLIMLWGFRPSQDFFLTDKERDKNSRRCENYSMLRYEPTSQKSVRSENGLVVISDPLNSDHGAGRPPVLIARELAKNQEVCVLTPCISTRLERWLETCRVKVISLGDGVRILNESTSYLFHWVYCALNSVLDRIHDLGNVKIVNFSNTVLAKNKIWYGQGPITEAIDAIRGSLPVYYRTVSSILSPFISILENRLLQTFRDSSERVVANSFFSKKMYEKRGIFVDGVIQPPIDTKLFRPSRKNPSRDYVLSYLGKESDLKVLSSVADAGVKLKVFGGKFGRDAALLLKHPNIEILPFVDDEELVDLYTDALFTLFPFTHEPFGYIPVESMACGTPVMTYNREGPATTVIDGETGWLVDSGKRMVMMSHSLWRERGTEYMRGACIKRARAFDATVIAEKWRIALAFNGSGHSGHGKEATVERFVQSSL
jgi:glycosyltransferase involved in cell wall biosynthesis